MSFRKSPLVEIGRPTWLHGVWDNFVCCNLTEGNERKRIQSWFQKPCFSKSFYLIQNIILQSQRGITFFVKLFPFIWQSFVMDMHNYFTLRTVLASFSNVFSLCNSWLIYTLFCKCQTNIYQIVSEINNYLFWKCFGWGKLLSRCSNFWSKFTEITNGSPYSKVVNSRSIENDTLDQERLQLQLMTQREFAEEVGILIRNTWSHN